MAKRKIAATDEDEIDETEEPQDKGLKLLQSLKKHPYEKRLIVILDNASLETVKVSRGLMFLKQDCCYFFKNFPHNLDCVYESRFVYFEIARSVKCLNFSTATSINLF